MKKEDKELLLKDLCARLPYGVLFQDMRWTKTAPSTMGILDNWRMECKIYGDEPYRPIEEFKMYLRPLSSMTEKEFDSLKEYSGLKYDQLDLASFPNNHKCLDFYLSEVPAYVVILVYDWFNSHHFDYRGLIAKGLAIEVTEENNPY